jgi:plastocyanin
VPPVPATIANFVYLPDPIRIPVNGTVTWTNHDPDVHSATAEDLSWSSPVLNTGHSYSRTFTQRGTYNYFCEPHPQMRGEVIVE